MVPQISLLTRTKFPNNHKKPLTDSLRFSQRFLFVYLQWGAASNHAERTIVPFPRSWKSKGTPIQSGGNAAFYPISHFYRHCTWVEGVG